MAKSGRLGAVGDLSKKVSPFLDDEGYWSCQGFHFDESGSLTKWQGFQKLNTTQLTESGAATFTGLFDYWKSDGNQYRVATGLTGFYLFNSPSAYAWNSIDLTACGGARTGTADNIYDFIVLNDVLYVCNGVDANFKYNGTNAWNMGITAPSGAATAANGVAGALTGAYSYKYTYYNSTLGHESNPSPVSNTVTAAGNKIDLSGLTASADTQVDYKRLYRTTAGGGVWLYVAQVANATTTYTDNATDATLGIAVEGAKNGVPPTAKFWEVYKNHVFMVGASSSNVYFSRPGYPNAVHSNDFRSLDPNDGEFVTGLKRLYSELIAYKEGSIWNGYGDDRLSFAFTRTVTGFGAASHHSIVAVPGQSRHIFLMPDGSFGTYNGSTADYEAVDIQPVTRGLNKSKLSKTVGRVYPQRNMCIWLVPDGAATQSDLLITYDYVNNKWATRDIDNTKGNIMAIMEDSDGDKNFYMGGYTGYVWQGDVGHSDDGSAISCELIDRAHPKGNDEFSPETIKSFYEIRVFFKPQSGFTITVSYAIDDPDGSYTSAGTIDGSATSGQGYVRFNAQGRRLYPKFTESGVGTPGAIRGWQIEYRNLGRVV